MTAASLRSERSVAVVVPTHNRRRLLARTLGSVLAQAGVEFEVIVVDDGSSDGTAAAVESCRDARIVVVRRERSEGPAAARNAGVAAAVAQWLAFVDDDDLWAPDRLSSQLAAAEELGYEWTVCGAVTVDAGARPLAPHRPPAAGDLLPALRARNVVPGGASGVLVRRELFERAGGFDPSLRVLADWDLWTRLAALAPAASVNRPLVGYSIHAGNMTAQVEGIADEVRRARAKHAALFAGEGDGGRHEGMYWRAWLADLERRGGRRAHPAWEFARLAWETRHPRLGVRAAAVLVSPGWVGRRDCIRATARAPGWIDEAESWLAPLREPDSWLRLEAREAHGLAGHA